MTAHLFLSASPGLLPNWQAAFTDKVGCRHRTDIPENIRDGELAWFDLGSYPAEQADSLFQRLVTRAKHVVVMSAAPDPAQAMRYFSLGARGYCHRLAAAGQLREIALVLEHGGIWLGSEAMQQFLKNTLNLLTPQSHLLEREELPVELTDREWAVAVEVARGACNREIASRLAISERTVKSHLTTVFDKLQLRDRVQLALYLNNITKT